MEPWSERVARAVGPVEGATRLGGSVWRVTAAGRDLVVKVGAGAGDDAAGLVDLAGPPGAPPVPEVVVAEPDLAVTTWVDHGAATPAHHEVLGRSLAALHAAPWPAWGGGSSWIGACPVDPGVAPDAAAFYGRRLTNLAGRCGLAGPMAPLVERLDGTLSPGGPSLVHGDLWWGNVLWGTDGRPWLIDPSAHGGHGEEDLAMLGLFGPVPDVTLAAYREVRPLADGWEEREPIFRLVPLLVHAVLFGGGYRGRAEDILRRYR